MNNPFRFGKNELYMAETVPCEHNVRMMPVFGDRLRQRAEQLGLSDAEVARRARLGTRTYGHYVTGRSEPNFETIKKLCIILETEPNFLLGFDPGAPSSTPLMGSLGHGRYSATARAAVELLPMTAEEIDLVTNFRKLSAADQRFVLGVIQGLLGRPAPTPQPPSPKAHRRRGKTIA